MSSAPIEPTLPESYLSATSSPERIYPENNRRFGDLRGVQWRIHLGILPSSSSSSIDDLRRVTADLRRRYAALRRRLLIDPHIPKDGSNFPELVIDNPLSQEPDSMWGRFFQKAELEKMVDQDLSRLYPEHGSYFQTPGCQGLLRRILLLWCIRHPNYGYRQGMHELLAPLLYVLQADIERLSVVRKSYEDYFTDNFDGFSFNQNDLTSKFDFNKFSESTEDEIGFGKDSAKVDSLSDLDFKIQTIILFSDSYGAEGELGVVLSEKFMEHDAYCMFDALMNGAGGAVAMADFFSPSALGGPQTGLPPVIEASSALYHLLSTVDSSLYSHLIELGVEPQYFALRWLRVLFGREFALDDLLIIWDEIFASDNGKLSETAENDFAFNLLTSPRGAFISALAVSMILYLRSSLLATENATACLQRLLKFPEDVQKEKLIAKAKSLVPIAIDINNSLPPVIPYERSKPVPGRGHSLSLSSDSATVGSPLKLVPESYWEEKWRVLHKEQEQKDGGVQKQVQNRIKSWSEKVKLRLSRTESDPSSSKANRHVNRESRVPVRRNLLADLARQLMPEENTNTLDFVDDRKDQGHMAEADECAHKQEHDDSGKTSTCLSRNTGSEENSSLFSDPPSPTCEANDQEENDSESSSVASNAYADENEIQQSNAESCSSNPGSSPLPVSNTPEDLHLKSEQNEDCTGKSGTNVKDRLSGRFHWLWKFGRNGGEGTLEKEETSEASKSHPIVECNKNGAVGSCATYGCNSINVTSFVNCADQNTKVTLKNLGQSMLENIQVIESVFQQDKGQLAPLENLSENIVGRGQMTALAALKELRKISNLISEV